MKVNRWSLYFLTWCTLIVCPVFNFQVPAVSNELDSVKYQIGVSAVISKYLDSLGLGWPAILYALLPSTCDFGD